LSEDDKPTGGVVLSSNIGIGGSAADVAAAPKHRILVLGDFGGRCDLAPVPVELAELIDLPARLGVRVQMTVPDHLGVRPAIGVDVAVAALRELDPARFVARVPEVARADALLNAGTAGTADDALSALVAALRETVPSRAPERAPPASPPEDDGAIDRLLDMIDLPPSAAPRDDAAKAAVSALIGAVSSRPVAARPSASPAAVALVARQKREITSHDRFRAVETAWRGLRRLASATERSQAVEIVLREAARDDLVSAADALARDEAADGHVRAPLAAVIVAGAFTSAPGDLAILQALAAAGASLDVPVIVSLDDGFLGVEPLDVARRDSPATLLDAPAFDAWRGLRASGNQLCAVFNAPLLRAETDIAPALYGEPALLLGAIVVRSIVSTGWPGTIEGPAAAVGGLDVAELLVGTRRIAAPLRAVFEIQAARQLAGAGITVLTCRPDRDQAFIGAAAMVGGGALPTGPQDEAQGPPGLATALVYARLSRLLQDRLPDLVRGRPLDEAARLCTLWLAAQLAETGQGARAIASPAEDGRSLDIELRFGRDVLAGAHVSLSVDL
jgi:hypothetical protein